MLAGGGSLPDVQAAGTGPLADPAGLSGIG